ncbi:MAG: glycosyltransferase family 4 protein [Paludibacteraceae bacterium]|nr:glycosyltransferase family 4 protein [Paludibacteraceae bacterium]
MKVLVNCYACSPYQGSEPGMGWNFVRCLSRFHELHILTESKFQKDIEQFFSENPEEKENFHFYFLKRTRYNVLRKIWPPSYYWTYRQWQKKALKEAEMLDEKENFDLIHQLNMAGYREPGYLWKMKKPLVWGPVGGFDNVPWCMLPSMGLYGTIFYTAYNLINTWQKYTDTRVKKAINSADKLIAATQSAQDAIRRFYGRKSVVIPEVGLSESVPNAITERKQEEKFKICWSGLHIHRKALNLLIEALAILKRDDIELHVIGKGSCTEKWKRKANVLHVDNIVWYGWLKRSEAWNIMQNAHVFCITSLSDLTSTVILEALSLGLPTIALDHCGFSNVLTNDCGIKIPIQSHSQVVCDIAKAIRRVMDDEEGRRAMALAAKERARQYDWKTKAEQLTDIYKEVCHK